MKKIWKLLTTLTVPTLGVMTMASMSSCTNKMYHGFKTKAPYLHELTFDDYAYDSEFVTTKEAEAFGCSSVRNGNFYGRNFDYVFNDTPEFVVRVKANKEKHRHESIGIAIHFGLRENKLLKNEYNEQLDLVPNITLDGINDAGVICSHNVVSMEPDKIDPETKVPAVDPQTNPDDETAFQLHQLFVPRYILDNADNVDHAVRLLKGEGGAQPINIKGDLNGSHHLHIMIAGKGEDGKPKTVIVEFFSTSNDVDHFEVVVEEKKENSDQEYGLPIMTNFYVNNGDNDDTYFSNNQKNGDERYAILKAGYATSDSFAGMEALMKQVMYSRAYRYAHNRVPMYIDWEDTEAHITYKGDLTSEWYSEFVDYKELYKEEGGKPTFDWNSYLTELALFKQDYWNARILDVRNPPEAKFWQTTHNSTYDMETKHLRVTVQEQYEVYFDYYL